MALAVTMLMGAQSVQAQDVLTPEQQAAMKAQTKAQKDAEKQAKKAEKEAKAAEKAQKKKEQEAKKKEKEAKKKQKSIEVKEIRLSPNIDVNDLNTKTVNARKFLEKGNKVKVTLRFRGREMAHMNASRHILEDFAKSVEDIAVIDKPIKQEGRSLTIFLSGKR